MMVFLLSDIDECAIGSHNCSADESCMNNVGSFTCTTNGNSTTSITNTSEGIRVYRLSMFVLI